VPIARYFIFVGGTLAALLLIAGWCLPTPPAMFANQLEHVSAEQNRKVPYRIKGFPRGCLWVSLLALILFWRLSDAKFVFCRDARASHRKS
jgi:hypothetical protein